ncbi:DUF2268 domain-containing putative Zn-dependent protease [Ekhidna sp. MALMAid0563]|uniref:DUF2268 domain-containing putative Zn-dependent protease n=1 Tax=Ekhidna sp. MALMAid0563 TaxID=3143937 RepID=UPI0032DE8A52
MNTKTLLFALSLLPFITGFGQPNYPKSASEAELIYSDLENFLIAYDQLSEDSDTIEVLKIHYFNNASAGLTEYIERHGLTPESLAKAINQSTEEYELLALFSEGIDEFSAKFTIKMEKYEQVLKEVMYPPTYLLVGTNKGIAQASPVGQLITIEKVSDRPEKLFQLIWHELSHFQQARALGFSAYTKVYSKPDNMLDLILREGGAEFIAIYLVGENEYDYRNKTYFESNEQSLKERFLKDLKNQDQSFWLWESLRQDETPALLGYTIGYRICESYYLRAVDKNQALLDILAITDDQAFLKASGYFEPSN